MDVSLDRMERVLEEAEGCFQIDGAVAPVVSMGRARVRRLRRDVVLDFRESIREIAPLYKDLPHLQGERYQTYMREAGVTSPEDLAAIVRTMERFGFARRMDTETFCFDVPIYRFLDLCMDMARQASESEPAPSESENAGEDAP